MTDMDEQTVIDFNNDILSTNSFICCSCKNLLKCPIMLIKNAGNMCNVCYYLNKNRYNVDPVNNKSLEDILKKMYFPCRYKASGCLQSIKYTDKEEHESLCEFKIINCVVSESCDWQDVEKKVISHILDVHKDVILMSLDSKFSSELDLSRNCMVTFVLKTSSIYIFTLHRSRLRVSYQLKPVTGSLPPNIFLKLSDNKKKKLKVGFQNSLKGEYDEIDVAILSRLFDLNESLKWTIKVEKSTEVTNVNYFNGSMLGHFECPVCTTYMKPPIFQCSAGHSVCSSCKKRLERCPTCRGIYGNTRNYSLEGLTSRILYPCTYQDEGCREIMLSKEVAAHELSCTYRPPTCFFPGCNFAGYGNAPLIKHLTASHITTVFNKNIQYFTMKFYLDKDLGAKKYAMIVNNSVFKFIYKQSLGHTFWGVEVVSQSTPNNNNHYIYELCLTDTKKSERKLLRTEACLVQVSEEVFFKQCMSIPNFIVHPFANNNIIQFHIKIQKLR